MDGTEFIKYFTHLPVIVPHFLGVFSINNMPTRIKVRTFFITNLSEAHKPGTHWIAIVKPKKGLVEIFDSLGFRPDLVVPYLRIREKVCFETNETAFQSDSSLLCGKFVITFCAERMLNLDLSFNMLLTDIFETNKETNDKIVTDFCENLLSL